MNRIYKVIWNNARGMYVVTSELAKNHSGHKSRVSRGGKWLAALTLAIGLSVALFKAGPGALAATTTGAGEGNIVGQVITTNSEISGDHVATRALGTYATVTGGYLNDANGNYSTVSGGNSNIANGQYSGIYGGYHNITGSNNDNNSGLYAAILGGYENTATGMEATAVADTKAARRDSTPRPSAAAMHKATTPSLSEKAASRQLKTRFPSAMRRIRRRTISSKISRMARTPMTRHRWGR